MRISTRLSTHINQGEVYLYLKPIPCPEKIGFFLLVIQQVHDEIDTSSCVIQVAIEYIPDGGDKILGCGFRGTERSDRSLDGHLSVGRVGSQTPQTGQKAGVPPVTHEVISHISTVQHEAYSATTGSTSVGGEGVRRRVGEGDCRRFGVTVALLSPLPVR
jgi:hypothetical protein